MSLPSQRQEKNFNITNRQPRLSIDTNNLSRPTPRLSTSSPAQFSRIPSESKGSKGGVVTSPISSKVEMKARATVGYRSITGNRSTPSRPTARQSAPVSRTLHSNGDPMNFLPPISAKEEEEEYDDGKKVVGDDWQQQICPQELLEQEQKGNGWCNDGIVIWYRNWEWWIRRWSG